MGDGEEYEFIAVVEGRFKALEVAYLDSVEEDEGGDGGIGDGVHEGVLEGLPVDVDECAEGLVDIGALGDGDGLPVSARCVLGDPKEFDVDLDHPSVFTGS